jgi:tetratricopeptide (TPR) repeat protein
MLSLFLVTSVLAEDFFTKGQKYEEEQRWSEAFSAYTEVLKHDPTNAAAHYRLGLVNERLGATDAALKSYQEALRLNPNMSEARTALEGYYLNQGVALRRGGQSDEAIRAFQQALSFNPASASVHFELGQEFEQRNQLDEALKEYQEAVRLDQDKSAPHANLAAIYSRQGQYEQAAREFQEVLRLNPNDPAGHYGLGVAYSELGQRDQAIASLKQAVRFYLLAGHRDKAQPAYVLQKKLEAEQLSGQSTSQKK